jgi:hypothetical protein
VIVGDGDVEVAAGVVEGEDDGGGLREQRAREKQGDKSKG